MKRVALVLAVLGLVAAGLAYDAEVSYPQPIGQECHGKGTDNIYCHPVYENDIPCDSSDPW